MPAGLFPHDTARARRITDSIDMSYETKPSKTDGTSERLIVGACTTSVIIYFFTSHGVKGQILYLVSAVNQVLEKLGVPFG